MKTRLDILLVSKGYFSSREKAKKAIMAGEVLVDGLVFDKPGMSVPEDADIQVKGEDIPYVSRGGLKLEKAINEFDIILQDKIAMDIGASTGGFTDCMLQNGAKKVYAIDVGYGQLDYKLRIDERVVNIEKCNFRHFENMNKKGETIITEPIDFASIDVSFISLKLIFPVLKEYLRDHGKVVALIKPQFEAGREQVGKKGIVKDKDVHIEVITNVIEYAVSEKLYPMGLTYSPITGAKGNIEYLIYLNKGGNLEYNSIVKTISKLVKSADLDFKNKQRSKENEGI